MVRIGICRLEWKFLYAHQPYPTETDIGECQFGQQIGLLQLLSCAAAVPALRHRYFHLLRGHQQFLCPLYGLGHSHRLHDSASWSRSHPLPVQNLKSLKNLFGNRFGCSFIGDSDQHLPLQEAGADYWCIP